MTLKDDKIRLRLREDTPEEPERKWLRALIFDIVDLRSGEVAGGINLRIGYTTSVVRFGGHIGYEVEPHFRGDHYAGRTCNLLKSVAKEHGLDVLWITCSPENLASRKTCSWIGATLVETVDLPANTDMYQKGERRKCRYR